MGSSAQRSGSPSTRYIPRPGHIEVQVLPPIPMNESDNAAVVAARDLARARIVAALGEPDLCAEEPIEGLEARKS